MTEPQPIRCLVIGYGSTLRRDDGIGPAAAEAFEASCDDPAVVVGIVHQLTPELAEPISRAERVVFVDAAVDRPPGQVDVRTVAPAASGATMAHQLTAPGLLAAAIAWYGRAGEASVVTVGAEDMELGTGLSKTVEQAIPRVVEAIRLAAKPAGEARR